MSNNLSNIEILGNLVRKYAPDLAFSIFEIGARPLSEEPEPFHALLDIFPKSKLSAFEVEEQLCADMNKSSRPNVTYYPTALGRQDGEQTFYETNAPMCCSLYKPNEALLSKYHNLDVAMLKAEYPIKVSSLDSFVTAHQIESIDFVKIDVQGAELDIFKGGIKALANSVFIVTEVEFIPIYVDQPLFGDVCQHLATQCLMFHKFIGLSGRALKPVVLQNDPNCVSQVMWSDAIFIKDINKLATLSADRLLKLGILAFIYGSPDLTFHCFQHYDAKSRDEKRQTDLHIAFARLGQR